MSIFTTPLGTYFLGVLSGMFVGHLLKEGYDDYKKAKAQREAQHAP